MKTYSVTYNTTMSYEAVVKAKNQEDAKKKVFEVIGDPIEFEEVREIHNHE